MTQSTMTAELANQAKAMQDAIATMSPDEFAQFISVHSMTTMIGFLIAQIPDDSKKALFAQMKEQYASVWPA